MLRYKNIGDLLIDNSLGCKVAITDSIALQIVRSPGRRQDLLLLKSIIKNQKDAQKDAQNQGTVLRYKSIGDLLIDNKAVQNYKIS